MSKIPKKIQKLRNARLNAVQALYMFEQSDYTLPEILNGFINGDIGKDVLAEDLEMETDEFVTIGEVDSELLSFIVNAYSENKENVDEIFDNAIDERRSKDRIELVLTSIIKCGIVEILYRVDTDLPVIIDEYIGLCDSFYDETDSKFVHALLHKVGNVVR